MVSHDCVAFYLLSAGGQQARQGRAVRAGRRRGVRRLPLVPADGAAGDGDRATASTRTGRRSSTATTRLAAAAAALAARRRRAGRFVADHFAQPGAATPTDRALRIDTKVMLVDDPVKRVDNMTMAWGLEARVPFLDHELVELAATCPPELKLADGGKGVLKEAARGVIPHEVIDRPKGYFPVPALTHLEGPYLDLVRDALHRPGGQATAACSAGRSRRAARRPQRRLTPLRGNKLWQLGLLELWLGPPRRRRPRRDHDVRAPSTAIRPDGVVLDLGWGRLVFGQTFDDPEHSSRRCAPRPAGAATSASTPRPARARGPAPARAVHRPELHLPARLRSQGLPAGRRCPVVSVRPVTATTTAPRSTGSTCVPAWSPPTST